MHTQYAVVGIGNAMVDVLTQCDDSFLQQQQLTKGAMRLIDEAEAERLYAQMGVGMESSGGSAGNTIAGLASLGCKTAFIGRVRDDQLGRVYAHDLAAQGVHFARGPLNHGPATGRCLIMVTPDAQRTMNTYLGAGADLAASDVDPAIIQAAQLVYMEGYLFDRDPAKGAYFAAAELAHAAGRNVALSLSDSFCVERHFDDFHALLRGHVDILYANEQELLALYPGQSWDAAARLVAKTVRVAVLTKGAKGATIISGEQSIAVAAEPLAKLVDTTGAGDLFAAGFLAGLTQNRPLPECGRMGALCAAEIISHFGARPQTNLQRLVSGKMAA